MRRQQRVAKPLLAGAGYPGAQPVGVGHVSRINNMDAPGIGLRHRRQHMRHGVERFEPLVDRHFQNGGRRVDRAVDRPHPPAVPAPANQKGPFAAVPARGKRRLVQPPRHQFATAQRRRQRRHA